jgi:hypothetical protein
MAEAVVLANGLTRATMPFASALVSLQAGAAMVSTD